MGDEEGKPNPIMSSSCSSDQTLGALKPLRCIVKLGGAAITCKDELESINEENLRSVCAQLRQAMTPSKSPSPARVLGMDWSRRLGNPTVSTVDEFREQQALDLDSNFIIVHGAGSFGHFQASRSGVHKGGLNLPLVKAGFVATRISELKATNTHASIFLRYMQVDKNLFNRSSCSLIKKEVHAFSIYINDICLLPLHLVTSLNLEIVRGLAREGIPSVGMSPFACGWSTRQRNIASANASQIIKALEAGFVPILHGDAVLDHLQDCTILSGDVIIRHLAQLLMPEYVVFLTDVLGVYDRPPTDPNAILLREIEVTEDGSWSIVKPKLPRAKKEVEITVAAHDTTGGMETKIYEAAMIAKLGITVYITKAGTDHSLRALKGEIHSSPDDWLGTVIHSRLISSSK